MNKKIITIGIVSLFLLTGLTSASTLIEEEDEEYVVPDYLEIGDLLYLLFQSKHILIEDIDTIAIYIGDNNFVYADRFFGVRVKDYSYFITKYYNPVLGYVQTANSTQKENAAQWAQSKVGQRYQKFPTISKKGSDNRWYTSELIWAAYYNQGIDIDKNGWDDPRLVTTHEIYEDFDTETFILNPVPSYVKKGDIVLFDLKEIVHDKWGNTPGPDHSAIYMGHDFRDGSYFINAGVCYTTYDMLLSGVLENPTFYYVNNANESQIDGALEWLKSQLGAEYQHHIPALWHRGGWYRGMWEMGQKCANPDDESIKTSDRFYCMELVWAAYYNVEIDIDVNGWEKVKPDLVFCEPFSKFPRLTKFLWDRFGWEYAFVEGNDIVNSVNTTSRLPLPPPP